MKSAFVTGAGKGLGKGFVEYLLDDEYLVFAGVHHPEKEKFAPHKNLRIIPLDLSSDESIKHAGELVSKEVNGLDLLVNNAGINKDSATGGKKALVSRLDSLNREKLLAMFDINTIAPFLMLQALLPLLQKRDCFVINISSCRASYHDEFENSNANYGYRASKAALNMMTYCSAKDLPAQVRTFAVHPGSVHTDMNPEGEDKPYEQAKKIIAITKNWKDEYNGKFLRYSGEEYPL